MQYLRVISTTCPFLARNCFGCIDKGSTIRSVSRLCSRINMESGKSSEASETRGVTGEQGDAPVKTASQLKKEAARQAKMEKFKKKQEQQAAMKDSQGEV